MAENTENNSPRSTRSRRDEICFWVVPGPSGKVKKLRCKIWVLLVLLGISLFFVSGIGFVMTDYARAQFNRATNYFSLKIVEYERDRLLSKNEDLSKKMRSMQEEATRVANYERGVKQRLEELASVVGSMKSLGVITEPEKKGDLAVAPGARASFSKQGVGGAEIDCEDSPIHCTTLSLDPTSDEAKPDWALELVRPIGAALNSTRSGGLMRQLNMMDSNPNRDLLQLLDGYIDTLKSVPFALPGPGNVSSRFGARHSPFSGRVSVHEGVDLSLPEGSHVLSTADGVVKEVRFNPTYGLVIDIEHTNRVVTRYAHLRKAFVNEGEHVCRGEVVGLVGTSGRSTGPHLHYEVRIDGEPRNPEHLIALGERLAAVM